MTSSLALAASGRALDTCLTNGEMTTFCSSISSVAAEPHFAETPEQRCCLQHISITKTKLIYTVKPSVIEPTPWGNHSLATHEPLLTVFIVCFTIPVFTSCQYFILSLPSFFCSSV